MSDNIYIYSAPIHSGKTTALVNWISNRKDVGGILSPVVEGQRVFMNVADKKIFSMLAASDESKTIEVGRYKFSFSAFEKSSEIIIDAAKNYSITIIDEIGPLELRGEGFASALKSVLAHNNKGTMILTVRDFLVNDVKDYFNIQHAHVVDDIQHIKLQ